jgi:hypothetical protein
VRFGLTRQSVHNWVRRYFDAGPDEGLLHDVLARQAHRSSSIRTYC